MLHPICAAASGSLEPSDLYSALAAVEAERREVTGIHVSGLTLRQIYGWGMEATGWMFKAELAESAEKITRFGQFEIHIDDSLAPGEFRLGSKGGE